MKTGIIKTMYNTDKLDKTVHHAHIVHVIGHVIMTRWHRTRAMVFHYKQNTLLNHYNGSGPFYEFNKGRDSE